MPWLAISITVALALFGASAWAADLAGLVSVIDGDTLEVQALGCDFGASMHQKYTKLVPGVTERLTNAAGTALP